MFSNSLLNSILKKRSKLESVDDKSRVIYVQPMANDPTAAWNAIKATQIVRSVKCAPLDMPIVPGSVRFVCISDTHSRISAMTTPIPPGDVLIHAGDITKYGSNKEIEEFNDFLESLPHRYKIVIAGNHDANLDKRFDYALNGSSSNLLKSAIYLEDLTVIIYGIKIYGTPWQPVHLPGAFTISRGAQCLQKWNSIPSDTDILVTHTPPLGHGDLAAIGERAGCADLLYTVQKRVKPKYHVFGHIHEGYGITTDDHTIFINCSICNTGYKPINAPIIFDYPLPPNKSKQKFSA